MHPNWEKERICKLTKDDYILELKDKVRELKTKNNELENRVEHLKVSRRVLMDLLEKVEREKTTLVNNLERALELERTTKRKLIRQNHPTRLALVKPLTLEQHMDNINVNEIEIHNGAHPQYFKNAKAEIEQEVSINIKETEKDRLKKLSKQRRW